MAQHGKDHIEEQFLLRVQDAELAQRIRKTLRDEGQMCDNLQLKFDGPGRQGQFTVDGQSYPVSLLDLPAVVESYKTLDDHNLVKSADIGQMLLVQSKEGTPLDTLEAPDGVTPAMKAGRQRWFRPVPDVNRDVMQKVEQQVLAMLAGNAPDGWIINDTEEIYEVDETTKQGTWKPIVPKK